MLTTFYIFILLGCIVGYSLYVRVRHSMMKFDSTMAKIQLTKPFVVDTPNFARTKRCSYTFCPIALIAHFKRMIRFVFPPS